MFKKLFVMAALLFSFSAFAEIDTSNLTDAQKADLQSQASKIAAQNLAEKSTSVLDAATKDPAKTMSLAATWGQQAAAAAEGFAKALGIAAHELNVNVNEFLSTPAGQLTAMLIIWKVAGAGLVHLVYGIIMFIITGIITRTLFNRLFTQEFQYVERVYFWGLFKTSKRIRVLKPFSQMEEDGEWMIFWVMIILLVLGLLISGSIITSI